MFLHLWRISFIEIIAIIRNCMILTHNFSFYRFCLSVMQILGNLLSDCTERGLCELISALLSNSSLEVSSFVPCIFSSVINTIL